MTIETMTAGAGAAAQTAGRAVRSVAGAHAFGLTLAEWTLLSSIAGAFGITIAGLDHLPEDLLHPKVLGGMIGLLATHVGAWASGLMRPSPHGKRRKGR